VSVPAGPSLGNLAVDGREIRLRRATAGDLPALVALLADDPLGRTREAPAGDDSPYRDAFESIDRDPAHLLVVAEDGGADDGVGAVVGTLQFSVVPGLSRRGALRAQIEAVRVRADLRDQGLGRAMLEWAIGEAGRRGCALVQLTTDKTRSDARRFYERLGFVASHEGLKLTLPASS
jgi:ribosomal protein S18 acetylase RimI-like enzyme